MGVELFVVLNAIRNMKKAHFKKVDELPEVGSENIIYLVPAKPANGDSSDESLMTEWYWDGSRYQSLGDTRIDLSQYVTIDQFEDGLSKKLETVELTCDEHNLYLDGEVQSFSDVLNLVQNQKNNVVISFFNILFRFSAYDEEVIWFDATSIDTSTPSILRYSIDRNDRCSLTQISVASMQDLEAVKTTIRHESSTRSAREDQIITAINQESERAQGVEEILNTGINEENARAVEVENTLANTIAQIQENLEGEIDALDVCIEQQTYNEGRGGYRKYRNGILEQWGISTSAISSYPYEHNLHTPFSSTNFVIFVTPREQGNFFSYAYPSSVSKFSCRIQNRDSQDMAVQFQYFARGRWK